MYFENANFSGTQLVLELNSVRLLAATYLVRQYHLLSTSVVISAGWLTANLLQFLHCGYFVCTTRDGRILGLDFAG